MAFDNTENTTTDNMMSASTAAAVAARGTPATLNLDDIFGDCFFTPDGDAVFLSEQQQQQSLIPSNETTVTTHASRPAAEGFAPVAYAGGIATTGLDRADAPRSTVMGPASTPPTTTVPFVNPPQQKHHLPYAAAPSRERKMSDQQKVERRERNREHAKRSRIRKKFLLESLQQSVTLLKDENDKLKLAIRDHLGEDEASQLLQKEALDLAAADVSVLTSPTGGQNSKVLDDPDYSFIKALQTAQQNFVVTDPSLPDNPIVYATQGFLNLTGYTLEQVLGRNCRFLQGPETDPKAVEKIRRSIEDGSDMSVCLLNYRVDGTTFWNQFFIAALRDASGNITNYVGVQCKVSDQYAANVCKRQQEQEEEDHHMEHMTTATAQG